MDEFQIKRHWCLHGPKPIHHPPSLLSFHATCLWIMWPAIRLKGHGFAHLVDPHLRARFPHLCRKTSLQTQKPEKARPKRLCTYHHIFPQGTCFWRHEYPHDIDSWIQNKLVVIQFKTNNSINSHTSWLCAIFQWATTPSKFGVVPWLHSSPDRKPQVSCAPTARRGNGS